MNLWEDFAQQPIFVLTSDQDWAPEWAIEQFLAGVERYSLPLHVFRTSPSALFDEAFRSGRTTQGWHPNFLPDSTQGNTIAEVIEYCRRHFPGATTARAHCFAEDTYRWLALAEAGIVADSQFATMCQGYLNPLIHWTGIIRLPVYFEDDVFFRRQSESLPFDLISAALFTPGLKILNFHPTFYACNTPSMEHYEARSREIFGGSEPLTRFSGRGTADIFGEIVEAVLSAGHSFVSFEDVVRKAVTRAKQASRLPRANA